VKPPKLRVTGPALTVGLEEGAAGAAAAAGAGVLGAAACLAAGSLEGSVSWAPDLWGAMRRANQESKATAQASAATLANATLSEQTALATAVIDLLQKTVEEFTESLRVVSSTEHICGTAPNRR
jgi:outer membrane protein TolC